MSNQDPGKANPFTLMLQQAFDGLLRPLMVCIPGRVVAFDSGKQRAQVLCAINRRLPDGEYAQVPVITDVPVQFPGDSQWYFWHQITPGSTEGLLHFSQRAIDTWINQGGETDPVDFRMFSAEDAFFAPGYRSDPNVIPSFVNEGCGMSSMDGSTRLHITDGHIELTASSVNVQAASFTHNGSNTGIGHFHGGVETGNGNTAGME